MQAVTNAYQKTSNAISKAIDLMDEAAAKLRMEVDSVPEELDEISRKIKQLEIEREAIKRENNNSWVFFWVKRNIPCRYSTYRK